jgi:hypothetical protein
VYLFNSLPTEELAYFPRFLEIRSGARRGKKTRKGKGKENKIKQSEK